MSELLNSIEEISDGENSGTEVIHQELWDLKEEVVDSEAIYWVDKRIEHGVTESVQFSFAARALISEEQRNSIKNWISKFFKDITYPDWQDVIVYDTDAKIIASINSFLTEEMRSKVRSNWSSIKMEDILKSVVWWTINYPKNKYVAKKKQPDWTLVTTNTDSIKSTIIQSFKSVLGI